VSRVASGCSYRLPNGEGAQTQGAVIRRFQQVPTHSEEILDETVQAEESLSLTGRLEAAHVLLPLAGRLMRGLDTIVGVPFRVVGYSTQDHSHCS
jgi:hypothetical protein